MRESEKVELSTWSAVFFQKAVVTSYMIPIVYRHIDSYSFSSSVPRYLAYLSTWLASVSWPPCVFWIA